MAGPYAHIACLVDDSAPAAGAAREARALADIGGAELTLVHVTQSAEAYVGGVTPWSEDLSRIDEQIRSQAAEWLASLATEVGARAVVLQGGHPGEIACLWAEENGADLLVVAPHRGRLARIALGSVAGYVAAHAHTAVLVVRGPQTA